MGWTILHHALAAIWPILIGVVIVAWSWARAWVQHAGGRAARADERPAAEPADLRRCT